MKTSITIATLLALAATASLASAGIPGGDSVGLDASLPAPVITAIVGFGLMVIGVVRKRT